MSALDEHTARTLIMVARTLYPYDHLDDTYYAVVVRTIEADSNGERVALLIEGAKRLDQFAGSPFHALPEDRRVQALKAIEGTPFFKDMQITTVRELFRNPAIWPHFGYEGPSGHLGGYVKRGYDQGDWIPDV
jgi:hypothetical protein